VSFSPAFTPGIGTIARPAAWYWWIWLVIAIVAVGVLIALWVVRFSDPTVTAAGEGALDQGDMDGPSSRIVHGHVGYWGPGEGGPVQVDVADLGRHVGAIVMADLIVLWTICTGRGSSSTSRRPPAEVMHEFVVQPQFVAPQYTR
jgi:hypothetical protein